MIKKRIIYGLYFITSALFAQKAAIYAASDKDFGLATEIYQSQSYSFAQDRYRAIAADEKKSREIREISRFYALLCGIKLHQEGAVDRFETFAKAHPNQDYAQESYQDLGEYFYESGDYKQAFTYYKQANKKYYKKSEEAFHAGYAGFTQHQYDSALSAFEQVLPESEFFNDAQYFSGHILYQQGKIPAAKKIFTRLKYTDKYRTKVLPYLLQTAYKDADYDRAIEEGKKLIAAHIQTDKSGKEPQKLIGESYFNKKKYQEAIPYLEEYKSSAKTLTPADYYRLGFSYEQTGNAKKAIENYNKIVAGKDIIAQKAYYRLGHSYIKEAQKKEALNAFNSAAEMDFDSKIKEDAFYNAVKLSYEIGSSQKTVPELINEYMDTFPDSIHHAEMHRLLVNYYQNLDEYAQAYTILKTQLVKTRPSLKEIQAQVGYKYGAQLYEKGDYTHAKNIFNEVIDLGIQSKEVNLAYYWLAQAEYQQGFYKEALRCLEQLEKQKPKIKEARYIDYNKGYLYFKLKNYEKAVYAFKQFIAQTTDSRYKQDAQLRLADSEYASGHFWSSLEEYQKAVDEKVPQEDYAAFQKAMVYGLVDRREKKQQELESFLKKYPQSEYADDAMYQLAGTYFKEGKNELSITLFKQMRQQFPGSHLVPFAELKKAQIYYNSHQLDKALESYKSIVKDFPNSSAAQESAISIQKIYTQTGQIYAYEKWIKQAGITVDKNKLSRLAYEAAEKKYNEKDFEKAASLFHDFLKKYPQSVHQTKAKYYEAESLYQLHKEEQALILFEEIKQIPAYRVRSCLRLAQIYLKKEQKPQALHSLLMLSKNTSNEAYQNFAQVGIMRIYHLNQEDEKALPYAKKVLGNNRASASAKQDAKLIVARNWVKTDVEKALPYYEELSHSKKAAVKAEAVYYKAEALSRQKHYKNSNDLIFDLASKYGLQKKWVAKGLLIMVDNYLALKDPYQANYTLETLIKSYPEMTEIIKRAKTKQKLINK